MWRIKSFEIVASSAILEEYEEVLQRLQSRSKRPDSGLVEKTMGMVTRDCIIIEPEHDVNYSEDPDDNKFINCALSGKALYIVSGDSDLLDLEKIEEIKIITVKEFLDQLSI